jgi:hypothetical protein
MSEKVAGSQDEIEHNSLGSELQQEKTNQTGASTGWDEADLDDEFRFTITKAIAFVVSSLLLIRCVSHGAFCFVYGVNYSVGPYPRIF